MSIEIEWKDFSYAKTLLEKLHAIFTDLGWMASMQLYEHKKPKEERVGVYSTNSFTAADILGDLLRQADKDPALQAWFAEVDKRLEKELSAFGGSFQKLLEAIHQTTYNQTMEVIEQHLGLCLQATSLYCLFRHRIYNEKKEVQAPLQALLDYVAERC